MLATIILVALVAPVDPPVDKELTAEAKKELTKLEGKWMLTKEVRADGEMEFTDEKLTMDIKGRVVRIESVAKFEFDITEFDPTTDPRCIDLKSRTDAGPITKGTIFEAIYKLDGDTLTFAVDKGSRKNRPASFDKPKDADTTIVIFKRVKE